MNRRPTLVPARKIVGRTTGSPPRPRGVMCDMRGHAGPRQQLTRLDTFSRTAMLIEHDVSRYIVMCRVGDVLGKGLPGVAAGRTGGPGGDCGGEWEVW